MNRHRFAWLAALIVLLLDSSGVPSGTRAVLAQEPALEGVVRAVVRVSSQRCAPLCKEINQGSGAIIHPSGVILTAYHVTLDPEKSPEGYLDDFIIEMSEDERQPATGRYRARIIAVQPSLDIALLRIDRTADGSRMFAPFELAGLPVLPLGSAAELRLQEQLMIAGYPFLGGRSIKVDNKNLTGFAPERLSGREISDAFLTIQGRLSEGYSGGPVLVKRNGVYRIVGIVIKGVGVGQEIGYVRSIDLLRDLQWLEPQARARAQRVELELGQNTNGEQELRINLELDTLDLAGGRARLVFYAFTDDFRGMPVTVPPGPNRTRAGQLAFAADVEARQFVDRIEAPQLRVPVGAPSMAAGPLKFRAMLWDTDVEQVLWQSNEWYRAQAVGTMALRPTVTVQPPHAPLPVNTPADMASLTVTPRSDILVSTTTPTATRPPSSPSATLQPVSRPGVVIVPVEKMAHTIPWLPLDKAASPGTDYIGFNVLKPPFHSRVIRQAFAAAVDREAICGLAAQLGIQNCRPATTFTPPETLGLYLYGQMGIPFDLEKAKTLLAYGGYPNGQGFPESKLVMPARGATVGRYVEIAEAIAAMWQKYLNVTVKVEVIDVGMMEYMALLARDAPAIYRLGWAADYNDPDSFLMEVFHSDSRVYTGRFSDTRFDRLVEQAATSGDPVTRQSLYIQSERILCEDQVVIIPLYHAIYRTP